MKIYRPYAPNQPYLLPPSPSEWLPEGHLAYFILDLFEGLDLGDIERVLQAKDHRGERPYSPRRMTALWLYGYAVGVTSSRKIERATYEDVAFRVLSAEEHPHFTSINEFRATHRQALGNLFHQVLRECMSAALVKLGHVAIDGTKMKANASKHKAMSYERMEKQDARLTAEIEASSTRPTPRTPRRTGAMESANNRKTYPRSCSAGKIGAPRSAPFEKRSSRRPRIDARPSCSTWPTNCAPRPRIRRQLQRGRPDS